MSVVLLVGAFLALWAGSTLLLSCLPWFARRGRHVDGIGPDVAPDRGSWVDDVEVWLRRR